MFSKWGHLSDQSRRQSTALRRFPFETDDDVISVRSLSRLSVPFEAPDKVLISLVGPAGLTDSKEIKHLAFLETVEIPNVSPCLSQCNVSASGSIGVQQPEFHPLEHSRYLGHEHLARYSPLAPDLYPPHDLKHPLSAAFNAC